MESKSQGRSWHFYHGFIPAKELSEEGWRSHLNETEIPLKSARKGYQALGPLVSAFSKSSPEPFATAVLMQWVQLSPLLQGAAAWSRDPGRWGVLSRGY